MTTISATSAGQSLRPALRRRSQSEQGLPPKASISTVNRAIAWHEEKERAAFIARKKGLNRVRVQLDVYVLDTSAAMPPLIFDF